MAYQVLPDTKEEEYPENFKQELDTFDYHRTKDRKIWDLSLLFLEGRQWVAWDTHIQGYAATIKNAPNYKVTVNLLLNIYRNLLSKLATTYPSIVVTPGSPSTEDILKAQASETILKYYWNRDDIKETLGKSFSWLLSCGTVGLHSYFDDTENRVTTEVISPFDLLFEPYVLSPEDSQWIAIRRHVPKAELEVSYPDHKEEIQEAVDAYAAADRPGEGSYTMIPENRVETFEIYWKDGKHAILMNQTYLYKGTNPLDEIPIEIMRYSEVPGKLWGIGLISPLIDMQWLYNKSRSQVLQNIELMANPKWMIPKSAGVNPQAITNRAGEKVFYNAAGGKPEQIAAAPLPSHVFDNITRLQSEMMDVSGIHSTSLGKRAVGVTSGKAMQTLAAQDMSQLHNTQLRIEASVKSVAESVLMLMQVFYKEERMIRAFDDAGKLIFQQIKNLDMVEEPEVFIEANSLFRSELQDKDKKIFDLFEMGLIPPEHALQELSYRTGNKYVIDRMEAMAHAQDLLVAATQGYEIEIFRTDDLLAFKQVFGDYIKSTEYYSLSIEIQDYIRDIYIAIENPQLDDAGKENLNDKVFPKAIPPKAEKEDVLSNILVQDSQTATGQMIDESINMTETASGFQQADKAASLRSEALMSPKSPGGFG